MLLESFDFACPDNTIEILTEYLSLKKQRKRDEANDILRTNLSILHISPQSVYLCTGKTIMKKLDLQSRSKRSRCKRSDLGSLLENNPKLLYSNCIAIQ